MFFFFILSSCQLHRSPNESKTKNRKKIRRRKRTRHNGLQPATRDIFFPAGYRHTLPSVSPFSMHQSRLNLSQRLSQSPSEPNEENSKTPNTNINTNEKKERKRQKTRKKKEIKGHSWEPSGVCRISIPPARHMYLFRCFSLLLLGWNQS